jgi:RHS repeat-associated protein
MGIGNCYHAGMMVAVNDGTGLQYLLTDHLGSTVAVTNASGTLTSQQRYLPFGGVRANANPPYITQTDFGYTFQRNLSGTGLMNYKARMYSPALGRFVQPDSIIRSILNPQSWNRYSYVENRPVIFNDPTGHTALCGSSCEAEYERPQYTLDDYGATFGVTFTDDGTKKWDWKDKVAALLAVSAIANKFGEVTERDGATVFKEVYGPLTFKMVKEYQYTLVSPKFGNEP